MSLVGLVDDIWLEVVLSSAKTLGEMVVRKVMFAILVEHLEN